MIWCPPKKNRGDMSPAPPRLTPIFTLKNVVWNRFAFMHVTERVIHAKQSFEMDFFCEFQKSLPCAWFCKKSTVFWTKRLHITIARKPSYYHVHSKAYFIDQFQVGGCLWNQRTPFLEGCILLLTSANWWWRRRDSEHSTRGQWDSSLWV